MMLSTVLILFQAMIIIVINHLLGAGVIYSLEGMKTRDVRPHYLGNDRRYGSVVIDLIVGEDEQELACNYRMVT